MNVRKICCLGGDDSGMMICVVLAVKCPEVRVTFVDPDPHNILKWNTKLMPEGSNDTGLYSLIRKVQNKNLYFTTNKADSIKEAEIIFVVTNPEMKDKGEGKGMLMNFSSIADAAQAIVEHSGTNKIIVECSCLPLRTTRYLNEYFLYNAKPSIYLQALSNPLFFDKKLGLKSIFFPDRVMIGHDESGKGLLAQQVLVSMYERWINPSHIVVKKIDCVELAQIASYALIAQKIASLCTLKVLFGKTSRPIKKFAQQLQKDFSVLGLPDLPHNIGKFCNAIKNLTYLCEEYNLTETIDYWKEILRFFAFEETHNLKKLIHSRPAPFKLVTLFGYAQEDSLLPELSVEICNICLKSGLDIHIYDPKVSQRSVESELNDLSENGVRFEIKERVNVFDDPYKAVQHSDLVVIHSYREAWLEIDFKKVYKEMKKPAHLFDHFHLLPENEAAGIGFQVYDFFPGILKSEESKY